MSNLIVMVGIPASGKSSFAELFAKTETIKVFSSDTIREEVFGDASIQKKDGKGSKYIFELMDQRAKKALDDGYDVVYDATSLTGKTRKALLERIKGHYTEATAFFIDTPLDECLTRNKNRDRVVPEDVILKMSKNLEEPSCDEGFDGVVIINRDGVKMKGV